MLGDGIFSSNGNRWKKQRTTASHMFTVRSLKDYMFEVFCNTTNNYINKCDLLQEKQGFVDIYDMNQRLTFDAFSEVAFGEKTGSIDVAPNQVQFTKCFDRGFEIGTLRFFGMYIYG